MGAVTIEKSRLAATKWDPGSGMCPLDVLTAELPPADHATMNLSPMMRRQTRMRHPRRPALAISLGLCVLSVQVIASAQAASPPPATIVPAATPAPGGATYLRLPSVPGPLPAGRYRTDGLGPTVTFELGDGWQGVEAPTLFELHWADVPGYIGASAFDGRMASDPCDPTTLVPGDATAGAFIAWLTGLSALETTTTPTTFAGLPATLVEANTAFMVCPTMGRLTLWGDFGLYPTEALRLWVVEAEDTVIIVTAESEQARDFDAFLVAGQPVLDSLAIAGPPLPDDVAVAATD